MELIFEDFDEFHDIWVVQFLERLELRQDLLLEKRIHFVFLNLLDGAHGPSLTMLGSKNFAEFALTDCFKLLVELGDLFALQFPGSL